MTQQLDFKVTDRRGREHIFTTYEGDFSPFKRDGFNLKYSHHPLEVMYMLHNDSQFKHLSLEKLCSLVKKHGVERTCGVGDGWNWSMFGPKFEGPYLHDLEVDPKETILNVAHHGGLSCVCCEGMVWEEPELDDEGNIVDEYSKIHANRTRFSETMSEQNIFIDLFRDYKKPRLAPFCKECLKKANLAVNVHNAKRKTYSYRFTKTDALVGLLGIYKSMLPLKAKKVRRLSGGRSS